MRNRNQRGQQFGNFNRNSGNDHQGEHLGRGLRGGNQQNWDRHRNIGQEFGSNYMSNSEMSHRSNPDWANEGDELERSFGGARGHDQNQRFWGEGSMGQGSYGQTYGQGSFGQQHNQGFTGQHQLYGQGSSGQDYGTWQGYQSHNPGSDWGWSPSRDNMGRQNPMGSEHSRQRFGSDYSNQGMQDFSSNYGRDKLGRGSTGGMFSSGFGEHGSEHESFRPFRGKGVKGYKRSDERIKEDVCERLSEGHIDASDIEVEVSNGVVTLTGTVPERHFKHTAEQLIDQVSGVQDITNQLRVKRGMDDNNRIHKTESGMTNGEKLNRNEGSSNRRSLA